jgi:hypothetical protein
VRNDRCYQESHKFLDDLTKIPGHITNKLAHLLNVPPIISKIWVLTYKRHKSITENKENSTSINSVYQLNLRELMKYNRAERDTSRIFAIEALDTFLANNI